MEVGDGFALGEKIEATEFGDGTEEAAVAACEVLESPFVGTVKHGGAGHVKVELPFAVVDRGCHSVEPCEHGCEPLGFSRVGTTVATESKDFLDACELRPKFCDAGVADVVEAEHEKTGQNVVIFSAKRICELCIESPD